MNKPIKTLSLIAVILNCVALFLAVLILTVLWETLGQLMNLPTDVIEMGSIIPLGSLIYMLVGLAVTIVLLCTYNIKESIVVEIIAIIVLAIAMPVFSFVVGNVQTIWVGTYHGAVALANLSMTNQLLVLSVGVAKISVALSLLSCGMRIAYKKMLKND